jgi:hypothetical protein
MPTLLDLLPTTNLGPTNNYAGENQTPTIQTGMGLADSTLDITDNPPINDPNSGFSQTYLPTLTYGGTVGEAAAPDASSNLYNNGFNGPYGFDLENNSPVSAYGFVQTYLPTNTYENNLPG